MGFEPTRAEPIGLAVQRLNHSATSSVKEIKLDYLQSIHNNNNNKHKNNKVNIASLVSKDFPRRELNPGLLGESQIS